MFTVGNIIRSVIRNVGRSILFIVISCSLLCFSAVYFSSIAGNEQLLATMGDRIPVSATITNLDGSREVGLSISPKYTDALADMGITNPIMTAESYGNIDRAKMNIGEGTISVYIMGANTVDAFTFGEKEIGTEEAVFLASNDAKCLLSNEYIAQRELDVKIGDVLEINLYRPKYDKYGTAFEFAEVAPAQLTVAGFYTGNQISGVPGNTPDIICPVQWLREQYENAKVPFVFGSFQCAVADPLQMNDFKAKAEHVNLKQVDIQGASSRSGNALSVNDKLFIETASQLMRNIQMLRLFALPVILLLIILVTLISFFLTRSRRQEILIARCLGTKKASLVLELVLENCVLAFIGGILAVPLILFVARVDVSDYLLILLLFLGCELIGSFISAFILTGINPIKLLMKAD